MADIRFQIEINGEQECTAGVDGFAVLSTILSYVKHDPARYEQQKAKAPDDWSTTLEEWSTPSVRITAIGSLEDYRHYPWLSRDLAIGDEITIRILGPGEADPLRDVVGPDGPEPTF